MQSLEIKNKFIELRVKGISYDKIASELQVSKQTLINWSKENRYEISNLKKIEKETFIEKLELSEKNRLENFSLIFKRIRDEIAKRDLSSIPTEKLLELFLKYIDLNKELDTKIVFSQSIGQMEQLVDFNEEKQWSED